MKGKEPPSTEKEARLDLSSDATMAKSFQRVDLSLESSAGAAFPLSSLESFVHPQEQEPSLPEWVPPEMLRVEEGQYEVEAEHARGGLGRVLIARDLRFGRRVAIKELLAPNRRAVARFVREAMVSARLQHPSIVPVYDAGRWPSGGLFYAMKLISGRSLRELVDEAKTLDGRLALVPHILAVADAMAYAHSHGIIHRDLKPSNVMIGSFGETVVIDWGLAKDLSQKGVQPWEDVSDEVAPVFGGEELTVVGAVLGTPQYMPPEQARGQAVDARADVYAIGALLFTLMVGKAPYTGATAGEILKKVKQADPSLFDALPAGVPKDLEAILRKAMARQPEDRYDTALELADDLRRFLEGQLVNAHEYSQLTLLWRWLVRHRILVTVIALCAAILGVGGSYSVRRIVRERQVALDRSNDLVLAQARTSLERDPTQTLAWLKTLPVQAVDEGTIRNLALDALSRGTARHVFRSDADRWAPGAASSDGRWLALGDRRSLFVWDLKEGRVVARLPTEREIARMSLSHDGKTVAFMLWEKESLQLWERTTGARRELPGGAGSLEHFEFSRDGRQLVVSRGPQVELVELASGLPRVWEDHVHTGRLDVRLSPDGRRLAYAGIDGTIHLVEVEGGAARRLEGVGEVRAMAFSPDGRHFAAGGAGGALWLWDVEGERLRSLHGHMRDVECLEFSPDGRRLLSASLDGAVRLWEVESGAGQALGEHEGGATWATFSADGERVASAGQDRLVRLWFLATGDRRVLRGHTGPVQRVDFLGDGGHLMSVSVDRTTRIWAFPKAPAQVLQARNWIATVAFSPDERYLAAGDQDGLVWRWDRGTGKVAAWSGHRRNIASVAFSPDSRMVASASLDGTVRLWEVMSGASRILTGHTSDVLKVAFAPGGQLLASTGRDGTLWLWDVATGKGRSLPGHQGEARALTFSPDGRLLASAGSDGLVLLTDVATGKSRSLRGHVLAVPSVAFSHAGRWLVSGGADGTMRLWDVASGQVQLLTRQPLGLRDVTFSLNDRLVAAAGEDGLVLVCRLEAGTCRPLVGHSERISKVDFSPDGRLLASAGHDRAVRLWDVSSRLLVGLHHHEEAVNQAVFSPDGHWLASAGADLTVRLWNVPAMPVAPLDSGEFRRWLGVATSAVITSRSELATP